MKNFTPFKKDAVPDAHSFRNLQIQCYCLVPERSHYMNRSQRDCRCPCYVNFAHSLSLMIFRTNLPIDRDIFSQNRALYSSGNPSPGSNENLVFSRFQVFCNLKFKRSIPFCDRVMISRLPIDLNLPFHDKPVEVHEVPLGFKFFRQYKCVLEKYNMRAPYGR